MADTSPKTLKDDVQGESNDNNLSRQLLGRSTTSFNLLNPALITELICAVIGLVSVKTVFEIQDGARDISGKGSR